MKMSFKMGGWGFNLVLPSPSLITIHGPPHKPLLPFGVVGSRIGVQGWAIEFWGSQIGV